MKAKKPDGRAQTSAANGKKGGRPRLVDDPVIYALKVPPHLHEWLKQQKATVVRDKLMQWMIQEHIV